MAQFGSALDWGSRGRGFKSRQPDQHENPHSFTECGFLFERTLAVDPRIILISPSSTLVTFASHITTIESI